MMSEADGADLLSGHASSARHRSVDMSKRELADIGFSCHVTYASIPGQLRITQDGEVEFTPDNDQASRCCGLSGGVQHLQVKSSDLIGAMLHTPTTFAIWWCVSKGTARPKRQLKRSKKFQSSEADAEQAVRFLRQKGSWQPGSRQRNILVLINPVSGQGKSKIVYQKEVQPILDASGLHVTVVFTERQGDAATLAKQADLTGIDCFAIVGGDGTVHELLQGLLKHPTWAQAVRIPFVQIPGGTGNALAANCGVWNATTAAYAICKGRQSPIDIVSIVQPGCRPLYSFLSLSYGMIANLDVGTDHLRWMGALRFTYGAVMEVAKARAYTCQMAILPADAPSAGPSPPHQSPQYVANGPPAWNIHALGNLHNIDLMSSELPQGWQSMGRQAVGLFVIANLPYLDTSSNFAPDQHLSSGELHMIWAKEESRAVNLRFLLAVDNKGSHMQLPEVNINRIKAFAFLPEDRETMLVVDGEQMPFERVFGEVHHGLCQVLVT